jgi:hypothetical protein
MSLGGAGSGDMSLGGSAGTIFHRDLLVGSCISRECADCPNRCLEVFAPKRLWCGHLVADQKLFETRPGLICPRDRLLGSCAWQHDQTITYYYDDQDQDARLLREVCEKGDGFFVSP